jgi:hypothetical protein
MSMADNIKQSITRKKSEFSSESELRDLINMASSKALKKFIDRMDSGEIAIDNVADFIRVIGAYKEINNIDEAMAGKAGQSALPELNMKQDKVVEESIQQGKLTSDDEGLISVEDMTTDDVADLIRGLDTAQNQENEGAF